MFLSTILKSNVTPSFSYGITIFFITITKYGYGKVNNLYSINYRNFCAWKHMLKHWDI